jgi:positive regulator of sigma E activity
MNETDGTVVRVEGEFAWVKAAGAGQACGGCASRSGCSSARTAAASLGGGILDKTQDPGLLQVPNPIRARPGDQVVIRAADGMVLRAAWFAYGVPLLLAMLGAVLALEVTGSDGVAAGAALCGLGAGFFALHRKGRAAAAEPILSIEFKRAFR